MNTMHFDVAIIGAGPAGSTAALAIQKNPKLKVALIDKNEFPRDKVCGDCVANYVPIVLNTISPKLKDDFLAFSDKYDLDTIRIVGRRNNPLDITAKKDAFISKRTDFDTFLFEEASKLENVTPITNCKITSIEKKNGLFHLSSRNQEITAKLIIGCDGVQGISRQQLAPLKKEKNQLGSGVRAYYKGVTDIPNRTMELHFIKEAIPGYFWIFPLPNGESNIGLYMKADMVAEQKINLRKEMNRIIEEDPNISPRFKNAEALSNIQGFALPLNMKKIAQSGEGYMFCGDAACLCDPLAGEGIGEAIISGRYAGWQVVDCFENNDFSAAFMKKYDKTLYDKLWFDHSKLLWIRRQLEKRPSFMDKVLDFVQHNKTAKKLALRFLS